MVSGDVSQLVKALAQLQDEQVARQLPSTLVCEVVVELARMMPILGPALHFAAYDVNNKLNTVYQHLASFQREGVPTHSLRTLMLWEIEHGCAHSSYSNPSLTRSVQRLLWMLDFVYALFVHLANDVDGSVQAAATEVYNDRLREHHRWLVQKAVLVALHACPSRSTLDDTLPPAMQHQLASMLRAPVTALTSFFVEQQLGDVQ